MKKYGVILADPPWSYNTWTGPKARGLAEDHYPTMSVEEILRLRVERLVKPNAALFLWVTPPFLASGLRVMRTWGFEYKTFGFLFCKLTSRGTPAFGMGHYTRANTEPCLLGIRGSLPVSAHDVSQVLFDSPLSHSQKPEAQYEAIERLYPRERKLELFARRERERGGIIGATSLRPKSNWR